MKLKNDNVATKILINSTRSQSLTKMYSMLKIYNKASNKILQHGYNMTRNIIKRLWNSYNLELTCFETLDM